MIIIITIVMIMIPIMIIITIVTIIFIIIINISVSRAPPPAQLGGKPASDIYMDVNVPLTITIADAPSPYRNHSASGGTLCLFDLLSQPWLCMGTSQLASAPLARSL